MTRLALVAALLLATTNATAGEALFTRWANGTALTTPPQRLEVGLVSRSAYSPTSWLELSAHPLAALVLPGADVKVRWYSHSNHFISTRHGLSYPSLFLNLIAREGTLGLLPPDVDVPQAVMLRSDVLLTRRFGSDTWLTVEAGVEVAPRGKDPVLLDFPFLYQRFAALNAPIVPHASFDVSTQAGRLLLRANARHDWLLLEEVDGAYALEAFGELGWSFTDVLIVSAVGRATWARYPVGTRLHWFPALDLRLAF